MQHFRRLLVGVDLSQLPGKSGTELTPPNREAFERALWLAERTSAELTLLSVLDLPNRARQVLGDRLDQASQSAVKAAQSVLDALVQEAEERGVSAQADVAIGTPWEEITRCAVEEQYDMVIVGTRNASGPSRLLFGSTAHKLIRVCPRPVWVTKPQHHQSESNVLVASGLDDVSGEALGLAVGAGQLTDMKLHLLHAVEFPLDSRMWHTGLNDQEVAEYKSQTKAEAERRLHEELAQTDFRTLTYGVQTHVVEGPPDVVILQAIEEHDVDLLVMGTVGRSGIRGLLVGNTAERLLPQVPCSVLVVKPDGFECPV